MTQNPQNRRKTLVVDSKQQKRMIITMSIAPAVGLTITMGLVCFFCFGLLEEASAMQVHLDNLVPLFLAVSGFVLISGFFLISNSLVISNRIAGPAYRIKKSLEQIRSGDLAFKVNLRKGDYLVDVRDELNLLLDKLNEVPPEGFRTREQRELEEAAEADKTSVDVDAVPAPPALAQEAAETTAPTA